MKTLTCICAVTILLATLLGCQTKEQSTSKLSLRFAQKESFSPNINHGETFEYRVTVQGASLKNNIVKTFTKDTKTVSFEFEPGSVVSIMIEGLNRNGYPIRRARVENLTVNAGLNEVTDIEVKDVPVFANVKDGAVVYANRFVPKLYLKSGVLASLSDTFNSSTSILEDIVSDTTSLSITDVARDAVLPFFTPELDQGTHHLMSFDPASNESMSVTVQVVDKEVSRILNTTSGAFMGGAVSASTVSPVDLVRFTEILTQD